MEVGEEGDYILLVWREYGGGGRGRLYTSCLAGIWRWGKREIIYFLFGGNMEVGEEREIIYFLFGGNMEVGEEGDYILLVRREYGGGGRGRL